MAELRDVLDSGEVDVESTNTVVRTTIDMSVVNGLDTAGDGSAYLSDDGTYTTPSGSGDMSKSVYDNSGTDGVVDNAELVNGLTVETAVPVGALFTDTPYNDSEVLKDSDTNKPVTVSNKVATMSDISDAGGGDMLQVVYDTNRNGTVDNSELVNGLTVETAVPVGALFTDTIYSDTAIQAEVDLNTAKVSNIDHPTVSSAVPPNAEFTISVATIDDLSSIDETSFTTAFVSDTNSGGTFIYDSTKSGIDDGGLIINGWVREHYGTITPSMFGAIPDSMGDTTTNTTAFREAMKYAGLYHLRLLVGAGIWYIDDAIYTPSDLYMEFVTGAWIKPTEFSIVGGFLTNVVAQAHPEYGTGVKVTNITIINPQLDLELLPYETADDLKNDNCMGFAREASFITVRDGYVKNCHARFSSNGTGGKGINFEHGVRDSSIVGLKAENCYIGVYINGLDGTSSASGEDYLKGVHNIEIDNILAINCESALVLASIDATAVAADDPQINKVHVGSVMFRNCGYQITADVNIVDHYQKGGAISILGSRNCSIDSIVGYNDDTYAPYNIAGLPVNNVAYGITEPHIGAVVWGHGNNIEIGSIAYNGIADSLVHIGMGLGLGDTNVPQGLVQTIDSFNIRNAVVYNFVNRLFEGDQYYPILDATAYNIDANVTLGRSSSEYIDYTDDIIGIQLDNTRLKVVNNNNHTAEGSFQQLHDNLGHATNHTVNVSYILGYMEVPYIVGGALLQESGTGANGDWFKFDNGLLICKHSMTLGAPTHTAGTLFASDGSDVWTYPSTEYISSPAIACSCNTTTTQWTAAMASVTDVTLRALSYASGASVTWRLSAVGRWK